MPPSMLAVGVPIDHLLHVPNQWVTRQGSLQPDMPLIDELYSNMTKPMMAFIRKSMVLLSLGGAARAEAQLIYQAGNYTVYADSIVQQGRFVARAVSSTELVSDYQSPSNEFKSPEMTFKF